MPPLPSSTFARLLQWRHSLFWTIVPAMFVVSCIGAALLMLIATVSEEARLREALVPAKLNAALAAALQRSTPLLTAAGAPTRWCTDTLQVLAENALSEIIGDRTGDANANGYHQAGKAGRLAVELRAAGSVCRYAPADAGITAGLRAQLDAVARSAGASGTDIGLGANTGNRVGTATGVVAEQPDGWTSTAAIAFGGVRTDADRAVLAVGVHILSPWAKLQQPRSVGKPMSLFILSINALAALVLVLLLIRRIRRADQAATAWTSGDLSTRINDTGRDEVSRLTRKFDIMADALSGVIEVKQQLAAAEERNRLARDLHDSAKQRAFALNLQLSAARALLAHETQGVRLVDAALVLTTQLQQDLSNVIRRQTASTIALAGLRHVLKEGVQAMLAGSGVQWSLELDDRDERALTAAPDVTHQLLLITMEAVANALKHARCTRCTISCTSLGNWYTWRIADNGTGLPPAAARAAGMGLASIGLRADGLDGGTFITTAGDDGGTALVVTFRLTGPSP